MEKFREKRGALYYCATLYARRSDESFHKPQRQLSRLLLLYAESSRFSVQVFCTHRFSFAFDITANFMNQQSKLSRCFQIVVYEIAPLPPARPEGLQRSSITPHVSGHLGPLPSRHIQRRPLPGPFQRRPIVRDNRKTLLLAKFRI